MLHPTDWESVEPGHGSYHRLMAADQDPNLPSASRPTRPAGLVPNASVAAVAAYAGIRTRVGDLVRDLAPGVADETGVPACPEWTVTETLAHLVGVTVDIVEGNIAEAGTKPWADAQAARFSSLGVDGLLDRWAETAPVIDSLGGVVPDMVSSQLVFDAVTHEHDICGALGLPGARTSDAVEVGVGFLLAALAGSVAGGSAPSLVISLEGDEDVIVGDEPAAMRLTATRFELLRAFGGRRSLDQVRALDWSGDPTPYLGLFERGPLSPPAEPVVE